MPSISPHLRCLAVLRRGLAFCVACLGVSVITLAQDKPGATSQTTVIELEGTVQSAAARTVAWRAAQTNEVLAHLDRLRTREQSRAALRLRDRSLFRLGELSELTVDAPSDSQSSPAVNLLRGVLMFFHRGNPKDVQFRTGSVSAAIRGTEFHVEVTDTGRTVFTLFDGEVALSNPQGELRLLSGEQASVDPGQAPVKTAMLVPRHDLIQWCLYYPGVLDLAELRLLPAEQTVLQSSLTAYRSGDLLQAVALVPVGFQPTSDATRIYFAAVLLAVGKVDAALPLLDGVRSGVATTDEATSAPRLAAALKRIIAVVKNAPGSIDTLSDSGGLKSATVRLADSYAFQAKADLTGALVAAREASALSPEFGFAWVRVAELEFSFGRRREALVAMNRGWSLGPRNAQAAALRGFLFAAEDRIGPALEAFNQAIALDGALGNAWLGRGLCHIRRGNLNAGREDLQVAALLEPQRALFRSYLGKAWNALGDQRRAGEELRLAKLNDPRDPTAYLYEALLLQEENRINEAITALEKSQELNDNRRVYRSSLLLDQDRAVRGANLASIYRDAGMNDWSVREASRAVSADYANWSAHQFLADSYTSLLDPNSVNLRYETPANAERLMANLLSPVGGAPLSSTVTQLEYSRLFDRDGFGFSSETEYQSRGAWSESAAQYGRFGRSAYAVEGQHRSDPGWTPASDFLETSLGFRFKHDTAGRDGFYVEAFGTDRQNGDVNREDRLGFRARDRIGPILVGGWHRAWSPESHSVFLASHLASSYTERHPETNRRAFGVSYTNSVVDDLATFGTTLDYRGLLSVDSAEFQHFLDGNRHSTVVGMLGQIGEFRTSSHQVPDGDYGFYFDGPVALAYSIPFHRIKTYAYHTWQALESVWITGGFSFDRMRFPANHREPPISDQTRLASRLSPKLGMLWSPSASTSFRVAHAQGMTGVSFDQSFGLEPTQVAGLNQAYRSLIPEAVEGANGGVLLKVTGLGWDQRVGSKTFLLGSVTRYESPLDRYRGVFELQTLSASFVPALIWEEVGYQEDVLVVSIRHLAGDAWSFGVGYQLSKASLSSDFPVIPESFVDAPQRDRTSLLSRWGFSAQFQHPSGFFSEAQWKWWHQQNGSDLRGFGDPTFWQADVLAGYRFARRRAELAVGVLNLGGQFRPLASLSGVAGPVRERTFVVRVRIAL